MTRRKRHGEILRLIREREISTQTELVEALQESEVAVVQTTVSRDIQELGLVKVRSSNGRLVYALPGTLPDQDREAELRAALRRWAQGIEASGNLVVLLTPPGYANALSQVVDESGHPRILATLAGENTILVVAREGVSGAALADELQGYLMEGAA